MKNFISALLLSLLFYSCTEVVSQQVSEESRKDAEFEELIRKAKETKEINKIELHKANEKTTEIVKKTTEKIVSLKQEVLELKEEINEIINKSDTVDLDVKFKLLPIAVSDSQENRK